LVERGELDHSVLQMAIDRYQLHDVRAGTSGTAGGEA
jgi:pyruvate dehydrogenase E1 component